jgi:hypothetical protein
MFFVAAVLTILSGLFYAASRHEIGSLGVAATNGPNTGQFTAPILPGGAAPGQFTYSWSIARTVSVQ